MNVGQPIFLKNASGFRKICCPTMKNKFVPLCFLVVSFLLNSPVQTCKQTLTHMTSVPYLSEIWQLKLYKFSVMLLAAVSCWNIFLYSISLLRKEGALSRHFLAIIMIVVLLILAYLEFFKCRGFDDEMRAVVARNLEARGINVHPRTTLSEVFLLDCVKSNLILISWLCF